MKRIFAVLLAIMILAVCCACTKTDSPQMENDNIPSPAPTAAPAPTPTPEPPSEPGTVRLLKLPVVYDVLKRGDTVNIIGENDDYYTISYDGNKLFIEKRFVRLSTEEIPEEKAVYAASKAKIFKNAYLNGTELAEMSMNDELKLLDELNGIAYVEFGDIKGYISSEEISDAKYSSWGYYGDYGGGGGGDAGGGGGGADGGDIAIAYRIRPNTETNRVIVLLEDTKLKGAVFSDDIEIYADFLKLGDSVKVTDTKGNYRSILYNGMILAVPSYSIRLSSEKGYDKWNGYAKSGAKLYSGTELDEDTAEKLTVNTKLTVLDEFEEYCLVCLKTDAEKEDAEPETDTEEPVYGYMLIDNVSDTETAAYWGYWGGDAGGGGGGGAEWTDPVL